MGPTGPTGPAGSGCDQPGYTYVADGNFVNVIDPISHEIIAAIEAPFDVAAIGQNAILRLVYLLAADGELAIVDGNDQVITSEVTLPAGDYTNANIAVNPNNQVA